MNTPKAATGPKRISDASVISALKANAGILTHAAAQLGIDRAGLHRRIKRSRQLVAAHNEILEGVLDAAEGVVVEAIVRGRDIATAKWLLSTRGRRRGYVMKDAVMSHAEMATLVEAAAARGEAALIGLRDMLTDAETADRDLSREIGLSISHRR